MTRAEAIVLLDLISTDEYIECHDRAKQAVDMAIKALEEPEVVRCEDCDNYDTDWIPNRGRPGEYWCPMIDGYMSAEDYCSRGERREQDDRT